MISDSMVEKLKGSFDELERCISVTRDVLLSRGGESESVIGRMDDYERIVSKQRVLADELEDHIASNNWQEVARIVRLINGLSAMIRDDAQAILTKAGSEMYKTSSPDKTDAPVC